MLAVVDEDNDPLTIWVEPRALDPSEVLLHVPYAGLIGLALEMHLSQESGGFTQLGSLLPDCHDLIKRSGNCPIVKDCQKLTNSLVRPSTLLGAC